MLATTYVIFIFFSATLPEPFFLKLRKLGSRETESWNESRIVDMEVCSWEESSTEVRGWGHTPCHVALMSDRDRRLHLSACLQVSWVNLLHLQLSSEILRGQRFPSVSQKGQGVGWNVERGGWSQYLEWKLSTSSRAPEGRHVEVCPCPSQMLLGPFDVQDDEGCSITWHNDWEQELWSWREWNIHSSSATDLLRGFGLATSEPWAFASHLAHRYHNVYF